MQPLSRSVREAGLRSIIDTHGIKDLVFSGGIEEEAVVVGRGETEGCCLNGEEGTRSE